MSTNVLRGILLGASLLVALAFLWFLRHALLLLFASILIALILSSLTHLLRNLMPIPYKAAYGIVLILMAGALAGTGALLAPAVTQQFTELADRLPKLISELREKAESIPLAEKLKGWVPDPQETIGSGKLGPATRFFSSTFASASSVVFILFAAIFIAASPETYRAMLAKLFPPKAREEARCVMDRIICVIKYWLLGQAFSMTIVGVLTGIALAIAGVPYAAALGIIAGLAEFIPLVGPVISAVPALLLAATEGTDKILIVLVIFCGIQLLEGNVLMPIVQRKAIELPPVVTLFALLVLGDAFGLLGMFAAAPLAAVFLVVIEELYLRRGLKENDATFFNESS